jgi:TonB family protein
VVTSCRVLQSVGNDDQIVIAALATWTFEPARCAERPIDARRNIDVSPRWVPSCVNTPLEGTDRAPRGGDGDELGETGRTKAPRLVREDWTCITHDGREGKVEPPQVVSGGQPTYSKLALERRQQGRLAVRCLIRRSGAVEDCHVVCSEVPLMEDTMLDTMASLRMIPPRCAGEAFDAEWVFNFRFMLPRSR